MNKTFLMALCGLFILTGCSEVHLAKKPVSPIKHTAPPSHPIQQMTLKNIHGIEQKGHGFYWCRDCIQPTPKTIHIEKKEEHPIHGVVYFDFNQSRLTTTAKLKLRKQFESLQKSVDINIQIKGYTDSISSVIVNQSLAQHRSKTVKKFIQSIIGSRKNNSVTYQTFAYGKCCYVRMPSDSAINRRVEVIIEKGDK